MIEVKVHDNLAIFRTRAHPVGITAQHESSQQSSPFLAVTDLRVGRTVLRKFQQFSFVVYANRHVELVEACFDQERPVAPAILQHDFEQLGDAKGRTPDDVRASSPRRTASLKESLDLFRLDLGTL